MTTICHATTRDANGTPYLSTIRKGASHDEILVGASKFYEVKMVSVERVDIICPTCKGTQKIKIYPPGIPNGISCDCPDCRD